MARGPGWTCIPTQPRRSEPPGWTRAAVSDLCQPLRRDAEQRRLDLAEAVHVAANAGDGVVEEERLGELDDRVAENRRLDRWLVGAGLRLLDAHLRDQLHDPWLDGPGSRGDQAQRGVALLVDERAPRWGIREGAVEAVERVEQARPTRPLETGSGLGQDRFRGANHALAD